MSKKPAATIPGNGALDRALEVIREPAPTIRRVQFLTGVDCPVTCLSATVGDKGIKSITWDIAMGGVHVAYEVGDKIGTTFVPSGVVQFLRFQ